MYYCIICRVEKSVKILECWKYVKKCRYSGFHFTKMKQNKLEETINMCLNVSATNWLKATLGEERGTSSVSILVHWRDK